MSFPRYLDYKDSGVEWLGEVPGHWFVTKTKHVVPFTTGWTPPTGDSASFEGLNLWANISDLGPKWLLDTTKRVSDDAITTSRIAVSPKGSLLFSFKLSIGQVSFAGQDMFTNEAIATFLPSSKLDLEYAYYAFPILLIQNAAENIYGAKLLNQELIRSASFALPPPPEQTQIAAFLDRETAKIDELVAEQQRLMALLKEKRQAVISHAVTQGLNPGAPMKPSGIALLGDVPEHWGVSPLRRLAAKGTSITYGIVQAGPDVECGIPYIRTSDMSGDSLPDSGYMRTTPEIDASYSRSKVRTNDLVVAIRASVGKGLLVPEFLNGANLTQGTARICPGEKLTSQFLYWAFNSAYCQRSIQVVAKGSIFLEITLDALRRIQLAVPPLEEQVAIAGVLEQAIGQIDTLTAEAQRAIDLLQERRTALIAAAVTGKIDIRGLT